MTSESKMVPADRITRLIVQVRGECVILDSDVAELYEVSVRQLNQAVSRNLDRFPSDFMFRLDREETAQILATREPESRRAGKGGRRYAPHAFTEEGVAMLSSVLRSKRAARINIEIMRAFVRIRRLIDSHSDLSRRVDELERRYDGRFRVAFEAIRRLIRDDRVTRRKIGFRKE